jgi:hypothetical protein
MLEASIGQSYSERAERELASTRDRQGIGSSRSGSDSAPASADPDRKG